MNDSLTMLSDVIITACEYLRYFENHFNYSTFGSWTLASYLISMVNPHCYFADIDS